MSQSTPQIRERDYTPRTVILEVTEDELSYMELALNDRLRKDLAGAKSIARKYGKVDPTSTLAARLAVGPEAATSFKNAVRIARQQDAEEEALPSSQP